MNRLRVWRAVLLALLLGYSACLILLCLLPVAYLPPANISDKLEHLLAFMLLAMLWRALYPRQFWRAVFMAVALGGLIEIAQGLSGYRHAELLDWLADSLGALAGSLLASWALRLYRARGLPLWLQEQPK